MNLLSTKLGTIRVQRHLCHYFLLVSFGKGVLDEIIERFSFKLQLLEIFFVIFGEWGIFFILWVWFTEPWQAWPSLQSPPAPAGPCGIGQVEGCNFFSLLNLLLVCLDLHLEFTSQVRH